MQTDKNRFKDLFSGHADDYAKYRPNYPDSLYQQLAKMVPTLDCAIDCGTGNGQAAVELGKLFKRVIATDPSLKQIQKAERRENVEYHVARAEALPVPASCADIITVAQALHWFQHSAFEKECGRVLRPKGIVAAWGYDLTQISPQVDQVVLHLYNQILGSYWQPERKLVDSHYRTLKFAWKELPFPPVKMTAQWSLDDFMGYLKTWSALQSYVSKNDDLAELDQFFTVLRQVWGSESIKTVEWPLFVRVWQPSI